MRTVEYRWVQMRVGLFVATVGTIFFAAVFYFGITGTTLAHRAKVRAAFDNVFGLAQGSPVEMAGVVVGQVDRFELPDLKTGLVTVTLTIDRSALQRLGQSSEAFASSHALVGQRFIGLTMRPPDESPLPEGSWVRTRPTPEMEDITSRANHTLEQAEALLRDLRSVAGTAGRIATTIDEGQGTLGHLVHDDSLFGALAATAENTRAFSDEAVRGHGALAVLSGDPKVGRDIRSGIGALAGTATDLRAGKGVLGRLTSDESDAARVDRVLANLDTVTDRLASAHGTLGALINDPAVLDRLNGLLGQVDSLVADVRRNPRRYLKLQAF
jgi:phospholipid/cholesterol/gamma-HCH transport system substrate-binding protein